MSFPGPVIHIGYYIRPSARQKGYGTKILELGLIKAKELGLQEVLLTCYESNIASKKIIEKNKGKFQDKVYDEGESKLKYWIKL
ncbi:GNAT family N-acetyltransferase [Candidatus Peregrinibacteria bacterium]|nr:GNAT family N-acetyltransferase [Candidatus Peregrinibacteria bacterium]